MPSKVDIWMPLYIGDYLADTSHLDAQRHGCYLLWMMHYWRKGPLCNELDDLVAIGKLRGKDAPSIAQALLNEFFKFENDDKWHQKRVDAEIIEWQDKSLKAKEKAKTAAAARWGKDAPSIATGTPQAMHVPCPSSSSSSSSSPPPLTAKPKKQKLSPKASPSVDPRFGLFRTDFEGDFKYLNKVPAPWDAKEASHLSRWLKANPQITQEQWRNILRYRRDSPLNKAAPLSTWIGKAFSWLHGTADEWGKSLKNGAKNGRVEHNIESFNTAANEILSENGYESNTSDYGEAGRDDLFTSGTGESGLSQAHGAKIIEGKL